MLETLRQAPFVWWTCIVLLGLLIGSFLNVVIYRLPLRLHCSWKEQCLSYLGTEVVVPLTAARAPAFNIMNPRSACPKCHHNIAFYDNIPVLSFVWLKRHCRHCHTKIALRYPLIELLTAIATVFVAHHFHDILGIIGALLLTYALITLIFIDLDHQLLPDEITLTFLWLGLLWPLLTGDNTLEARLVGAVLGYVALYSVYAAFKLCTGKEGMGHGDFKLLAMLGAWLGFKLLPQVILVSSAMGACVGLLLLLLKKLSFGKPMPFGPYLAIAGWVALMYGPNVNQWYWQAMGFSLP